MKVRRKREERRESRGRKEGERWEREVDDEF